MKEIKIKGARTHNLKNISINIPKDKLVVFTGVSGSGKSSLAFDTIFAEGQRRYVDSLSPYARQFMGQMDRPDVDSIEGLSPAIAINQKALSHNPRSIVATLTEIYDYMRVLWARIGQAYCPLCSREIKKLTIDEIFSIIIDKANELKVDHITILSPVVRGRKGEYYQLLYDFLHKGFSKARIDGEMKSLHERVVLSRYKTHDIEIVIDQLLSDEKTRLFEALEQALNYSDGLVNIIFGETENELLLSSRWACAHDGFSFGEIEPRLFSFNSPYGACGTCHGIGKESFFAEEPCPSCNGKRLKDEALSIKIRGHNIWDVASLSIEKASELFLSLEPLLNEKEKKVSAGLVVEISSRLEFLLEVGLDYICLNQEASTLSRGEAQRIRLASQIGSKLSGTLYVLDEPTIGLHERDNEKLIQTLKNLRNLGNTVIVVEHDEQVIRASDYLIDLGPGAGIQGGKVIVAGDTNKLIKDKTNKSLTLDYLRGEKDIGTPGKRTKRTESLKIIGARLNNLKNVDVEIPLRKLVAISGVSGGGKSSLLEVIYKNTNNMLHGFKDSLEDVSRVLGTEYINRVVEVDQSPIGRTPRSNPATYTGLFTPIRELFSNLEDSRRRGYNKSHFSFNVKGGRCEACTGAGFNLIEMHFLPPILVRCEVCKGKRFNREVLEVKYNDKNISDILNMSVDEALDFFKDIYSVVEKLKVLEDIGLGYIKLGQNAPTLSGGEAQRVKLAKELSNASIKTVYLLDEPTTGLHYHDINLLLKIIQRLIDRGNTVVVIEHNLHLIRSCDWVIDLGPGGGENGGKIVATGTPKEISNNKNSFTGKFLKKVM
ncbi:MAG: excinuclease ABC subunit UvrA [Candidatus Nealsonbacteria bacterium]|nr:excinuclease ABC subunit UvrA [Candidatus Nealsonbacteria bacterium]